MDNETVKTNDVNNTSTQKTVRIKPLAKQPLVGVNTESKSVKKVATNVGASPDVITNTARIVKLNVRPNISAGAPIVPPSPASPAAGETQTAAIPKSPAFVKPAISIPASDNTQTAAVPKAPAPAAPTINLTPAGDKNVATVPHTVNIDMSAQTSDDATVKLKRPERKTMQPMPSPAVQAPAASAAPTVAAPKPAVTSQTPTVQLKLNKQEEPAAAAPVVAPPVAAPVAAPAAETPAPAAAEVPPAPAKNKKNKNSKASPVAAKNADDEMFTFRLSVGFVAVLFLLAAVTFCTVQYFNMYQPRVFGKYIQIPLMENVGK